MVTRAPAVRRAAPRARAKGNPRNAAPGTRNISTSEYKMPTTRTAARANYAYPRGAGADRGKRPSYPIVPKARARAARSYAARRNTAGSLSHVDRAIRARYGSVRAIYAKR